MEDKTLTPQADKKVVRQSNIELLRIIAMIAIIAHHFVVHGQFEFDTDVVTFNSVWTQFIRVGGKIGVNLFVLITGYFMYNTKKVKVDKILKLIIQILFYSLILFGIFGVYIPGEVDRAELNRVMFPVIYSQWWFASTYVFLLMISPFLNKFILALNRKEHKRLLILLTVCWCGITSITAQWFQNSNLLWFMYLYILAAYIRIYDVGINCKKISLFFISLLGFITVILSAVGLDFWATTNTDVIPYITSWYGMQKAPILLSSVFGFLFFLRIDIGSKKWINVISSAMFGVYLIHDNDYLREYLWTEIFHNASYADSPYLVPYSLAVIAIVFVVCTLIELARIYLIEKRYIGLLNKLANRISKKISD